MVVSWLTQICVTRPQWVKQCAFSLRWYLLHKNYYVWSGLWKPTALVDCEDIITSEDKRTQFAHLTLMGNNGTVLDGGGEQHMFSLKYSTFRLKYLEWPSVCRFHRVRHFLLISSLNSHIPDLHKIIYICSNPKDKYDWCCKCLVVVVFFTQGQFWLLGIVDARVCLSECMSVCVNHEFVRAITHQPFKLGLANLDFKCKTLWLRALLFWGVDWYWPSRSNDLKRQILPYFELVHTIAHRQFKLRIYKFWPTVYLSNVKIKISIYLGIYWPWPWILFLI